MPMPDWLVYAVLLWCTSCVSYKNTDYGVNQDAPVCVDYMLYLHGGSRVCPRADQRMDDLQPNSEYIVCRCSK